jgi:hypothetical protein
MRNTNTNMCVCARACARARVCVRRTSETPCAPAEEGYLPCAGNSLSGLSDIFHMCVSVNCSTYCHRTYCILTVISTLTYIPFLRGAQGLLARSVCTVYATSTWCIDIVTVTFERVTENRKRTTVTLATRTKIMDSTHTREDNAKTYGKEIESEDLYSI